MLFWVYSNNFSLYFYDHVVSHEFSRGHDCLLFYDTGKLLSYLKGSPFFQCNLRKILCEHGRAFDSTNDKTFESNKRLSILEKVNCCVYFQPAEPIKVISSICLPQMKSPEADSARLRMLLASLSFWKLNPWVCVICEQSYLLEATLRPRSCCLHI